MFAKYPLKFLDDPKHAYGKGESMRTITRKGFKQDNPGANKFLENFHWSIKILIQLMMKINNGMNKQKAVDEFIKDHPKQVKEWLKGVPDGKGKKIKIGYTPYDYEIATTTPSHNSFETKGV